MLIDVSNVLRRKHQLTRPLIRSSAATITNTSTPSAAITVVRALPPFFNGDDDEGCTRTRTLSSNLCYSDGFPQWNSGHDESVEVNQRALIDKVLARYSGEFTGALRTLSAGADVLNISL